MGALDFIVDGGRMVFFRVGIIPRCFFLNCNDIGEEFAALLLDRMDEVVELSPREGGRCAFGAPPALAMDDEGGGEG